MRTSASWRRSDSRKRRQPLAGRESSRPAGRKRKAEDTSRWIRRLLIAVR